jgi:hypothetical protein
MKRRNEKERQEASERSERLSCCGYGGVEVNKNIKLRESGRPPAIPSLIIAPELTFIR